MAKLRLRAKFGNRTGIQGRRKVAALIVVFITFLFLISWIVNFNIKPPLLKISGMRAKNKAVQAINEAIIAEFSSGIEYENLFRVKTDERNKITILQANTMFMNNIASRAALNIQSKLEEMSTEKVVIPLGSILGSKIFANLGPKFNVKVLPMGTVAVDFVTGFEEAGINQTRHKIHLAVNTQVGIVLPLARDIINVDTQIPIAETIIVGDIPQSYIFVPENNVPGIIPERAK